MKRIKGMCIKDRTIKLPCLVGFSVIFLGGICAAMESNAATYECLNSTTLVEITASEEDCPPILACDDGYSCQPVIAPPPPGEQQQYPPANASAWVATLGCSSLIDVPLDDSRWGERQKGEVYAQENNKCLSFYWPNGGAAKFDLSATLSNPARWNDYLLSDNRPPSGGGYTIGTGKETIRFNDGGSGGMTVFKSEDDTQPPPTGKTVLAPWVDNGNYWAIDGKPTILAGASNQPEPFLYTNSEIITFLDEQVAAGSNLIRNTMATYPKSPRQVQPYLKINGKYDLHKENSVYWNGLAYLISEAAKRGIIVSIDLFDPWTTRGAIWNNGVWSPQNNSTYTTATGVPNVWEKAPYTEQNPIYRAPFDNKMSVPYDRQKDFVSRVLMAIGANRNVVVVIENETSSPAKWTDHWANYLRWKGDKLGVEVQITDMRGDYDANAPDYDHVATSPLYQFLEVSQVAMGGVSDQAFYDQYLKFINKYDRPANNHKRYCWSRSWGEEYKCTIKRGVNRMWLAFFSGAAGVRHHKGETAGLGLQEATRQQLKAVRWWVNNFEVWNAKPANSVLGNRSANEAYAMTSGTTLAIYFTGEGDGKVSLSRKYDLSWYNTETNAIKTSKGVNSIDAGKQKWLIIAKLAGTTPPPTDFLTNYTNPNQSKLPSGVYYPKGQEFWATQYSAYGSYFEDAKKAGLGGVYYHDPKNLPNYWESYARAGMQSIFHLRQNGDNNWGRILRDMKTPATKKVLADRIREIINQVQANPELNAAVFAWYGREEMIYRPTTPLAEQQAYGKMMLDIIAATDKKKRPLYISERDDTSLGTMKGNICVMDGSMKQNYLIKKEGYGFGDTAIRILIHQWAKDTVDAARHGDKNCPSITGLPKAAIPTLSAYIDPENTAEQNTTWLRKAITYDVFVSMTVKGVTGISAYAYNNSSTKTGKVQQKLYNELLGFLSKSGVGRAFIWGDDRNDISTKVNSGPTEVEWKKYRTVFTAPSYFLRNVQQGNSRYLLVTNNAKENITLSFTGIPAGLKLLNMLSGKETHTSNPMSQTIEPLGVRLFKISI